MKPSPFTYHRPATLAQALAVLAQTGGKVLAGGQSLLPILSMRLAAPDHLVDINQLPDLAHVTSTPDGVRIGALARHRAVERDDQAARVQPLLRQATAQVAHPTIRNRGTSVGSLAHADPSGELTAVLALTGGSVTLASVDGQRTVPASGFFLGPLESSIRPGELALEAFFPAFPAGTGTAFVEIARRHGDYAICGVAAAFSSGDSTGRRTARVAYLSMAPVPAVRDLDPPDGDPTRPDSWQRAAAAAVGSLEPEDDLHASAGYRAQLARVLTARALVAAAAAAAAARAQEAG